MESLLRAVLTSPDNLRSHHANPSQSTKRDIKMANPYLHAALTSSHLKPRPALKLTKSDVEQPPNEAAGDKRPNGQSNLRAPSRHSKLLEALISGVNQPANNNQQSSVNSNSNGMKTDKNSKKPEALQKSRLFMALTSPMVALDNWSYQDNRNQSENRPAKAVGGKANGTAPHELTSRLNAISRTKSNKNPLDRNRTSSFGGNNSFSVDSQEPVCNINKKKPNPCLATTPPPTMIHIKCEPRSLGVIDHQTDLSWEITQEDQRKEKMVCSNELECNMDVDEGFNGGVSSDDDSSRGSDDDDNRFFLSDPRLMIKRECEDADDEAEDDVVSSCGVNKYAFTSGIPRVKVGRSIKSDDFSSASTIGANISAKYPQRILTGGNHRQETESALKRKNNDPIHNSRVANKDDRGVTLVPFKKKKILIERNAANRRNPQIDSVETNLDGGPVPPNRESGIFQKKSSTDAQILRRVLTEGICELRDNTHQTPLSNSQKSFAAAQIKDGHHRPATNLSQSSASSSLINPNVNQPEKSLIKSQILRAALSSVEPIVPLRKPNPSESDSPSGMKISPTAMKNETSSSGSNVTPRLCSNTTEDTDCSGTSVVKNSEGEKISSVFGNRNGQDSSKTAAEDKPPKPKCQLLMAALTASDNSKKSHNNLLNTNESAPKQTSSEILREALNDAEKDSQGIGAKHSQLLRAALTAVDTNKAAAKSWHQTNTKLTNSRLLRAVLTGKYIPDTVESTDYSKATPHHRKGGPTSCNVSESKNDFSVSNTKLGVVTRSYDIVEITPNLGASAAAKKDKVQKSVGPSVSCNNTRSGGNSILRAVLTGAIDISHPAHESTTKNNSLKHPELVANANEENHKGIDIVSSCYNTIQDRKVKNEKNNINNNSHRQPLSPSSSSSSSSLSSASDRGCKEQCCEYCGKYHSRGDSLWEYTSQFAGDTPHLCYMCDQSFSFTCLFLDHMDTHTDISSKYKCEFCGRHFKHVLSYIMCRLSHIEAAQKEEKISCNVCDCQFTCHNKLRQHTRIHARDRFACKFCGKEFHQRVNCYLHERDHVDNKMSYTCKMCGEKFELASDLKAHQQTHYTAELFKCSKCIKCFVTPKALKLHEKTHIPVDHQGGETECNKNVYNMQGVDHQGGGNSRDKHKFLCDGCEVICASRYTLAKHKATCGGGIVPYTDKKFQVDMVSHSLVAIKD